MMVYKCAAINGGAYFILLSEETPLSILATIFINSDLEVAIYQKQLAVPFSAYKHIISFNKLTLLSQVFKFNGIWEEHGSEEAHCGKAISIKDK